MINLIVWVLNIFHYHNTTSIFRLLTSFCKSFRIHPPFSSLWTRLNFIFFKLDNESQPKDSEFIVLNQSFKFLYSMPSFNLTIYNMKWEKRKSNSAFKLINNYENFFFFDFDFLFVTRTTNWMLKILTSLVS